MSIYGVMRSVYSYGFIHRYVQTTIAFLFWPHHANSIQSSWAPSFLIGIFQGQKALRQIQKESQLEHEDPDKLYAEEAEAEEGMPNKKQRNGKGKARGRGRARGGGGRGGRGKKDSGSQGTSTNTTDQAGTSQAGEEPVEQGPAKKQNVSAEEPVTPKMPPSKRKKSNQSTEHLPKSPKVSEKAPDVCEVEDWYICVGTWNSYLICVLELLRHTTRMLCLHVYFTTCSTAGVYII